jgi:phage nucleotide-binding protein
MAKISSRKKKQPKTPKVVRSIQPVKTLTENIVALIYGKSGRGKTKTAATFPGPVLFLDINNEKGLKTVRNVKDVQFAKVRTWTDFTDLFWWLRDEKRPFETIVLDQITGLQDLCMKEVRNHFRMDDDEPFQGFKKFGKLAGDMKTWLQNYRELSDFYHIVFIAHERAFDSEQGEGEIDPAVGARVMPSVGSFVEGACDIIGHCYVGANKAKNKKGKIEITPEYRMRIGPHSIYTTKIRRPPDAGPLPDYVVNPSYRKLVAIEAGKVVNTVKKEKVNGKKQAR